MSFIPSTPSAVIKNVESAKTTPNDGPGGISDNEYSDIKGDYGNMLGGDFGRMSVDSRLNIKGYGNLQKALSEGKDYSGYKQLHGK